MSQERTIRTIRDTLCVVFAQVDAWFDQPEEMRRFKPVSGGGSGEQLRWVPRFCRGIHLTPKTRAESMVIKQMCPMTMLLSLGRIEKGN